MKRIDWSLNLAKLTKSRFGSNIDLHFFLFVNEFNTNDTAVKF